MMNKAITIIIFCLLAGHISAQETEQLSEERKMELTKLNNELLGTYQIQMIGTRALPAVPFDLVETVDSMRKEAEVTYFYLKPNIRVMVLPQITIGNKDFEPLQRISYVNE